MALIWLPKHCRFGHLFVHKAYLYMGFSLKNLLCT